MRRDELSSLSRRAVGLHAWVEMDKMSLSLTIVGYIGACKTELRTGLSNKSCALRVIVKKLKDVYS